MKKRKIITITPAKMSKGGVNDPLEPGYKRPSAPKGSGGKSKGKD